MSQSSANDRQVGGFHYQTNGEQHWDRVYRMFGPGYFIGCITKYVERYQSKNGYEDLLKAQHFLEKLIELEGMKPKKEADPAEPTGYGYVNQDQARILGSLNNASYAGSPVGEPEPAPDPSYNRPPGRRF